MTRAGVKQEICILVGIVGEVDEADKSVFHIWTHRKFDIGYNGNQIVDVNITSENKVKLVVDESIDFTYQVPSPSDTRIGGKYYLI